MEFERRLIVMFSPSSRSAHIFVPRAEQRFDVGSNPDTFFHAVALGLCASMGSNAGIRAATTESTRRRTFPIPAHRQNRILLGDGNNRIAHAQGATSLTLRKAYPAGIRVESMGGNPQPVAEFASCFAAGTARVRAHSRSASISSARVSRKRHGLRQGIQQRLRRHRLLARNMPRTARPALRRRSLRRNILLPPAATFSRSNSAGFRFRFASWIEKICLRSAWTRQIDEKQLVKTSLCGSAPAAAL